MLYFWLKWIHILSSTLLFGTGLGSAFYLYRAHLSRNDQAVLFAARNVVLADWFFTTPSVVIQPLTGFWLMHIMHYQWPNWMLLSFALFILTGACWLPVVWIQIQIKNLAVQAVHSGSSLQGNAEYQKYMQYWFWLGWPAFSAVIGIFYLMVFKPQF